MTRPPLVLGLTLCDDVVTYLATGKVSVLRAFTGLAIDAFPGVPAPYCAFAALTAGQGEARFTLEIARQVGPLDDEVVERFAGTFRFVDPLQTIYWLYRISHFAFPAVGEYLFTLRIDGE